jgi:isopentenyl-diphosphate delta-isomerase
MNMSDLVILVDESDNEIGYLDKLEAHQKGMLHRAFSVLIFNSAGELLLQKRAAHKYHSSGLWTNTCCSHPKPNERMVDAVQRRLQEEMGIECETKFAYKFLYRAELDRGLIEHELDYVFTGICDDKPVINAHEVADWKFISLAEIRKDLVKNQEAYTFWFKEIVNHPEFESFTPAGWS